VSLDHIHDIELGGELLASLFEARESVQTLSHTLAASAAPADKYEKLCSQVLAIAVLISTLSLHLLDHFPLDLGSLLFAWLLRMVFVASISPVN